MTILDRLNDLSPAERGEIEAAWIDVLTGAEIAADLDVTIEKSPKPSPARPTAAAENGYS